MFIPKRTLDSCHKCLRKVESNESDEIIISYASCQHRQEISLTSESVKKRCKDKDSLLDRSYLLSRCQVVSVPNYIYEQMNSFLSQFPNLNIKKNFRPKVIELDPFKAERIKHKKENQLYLSKINSTSKEKLNDTKVKEGKQFELQNESDLFTWCNLAWTRNFYSSCPHLFKKDLTYQEKNWWSKLSKVYVFKAKQNILKKPEYKSVW